MNTETPIDMVLHCPACGVQHIDAAPSLTVGDEQIDAFIPEPDGSAEANKVRVEVQPGVIGYEYDEVDAWSRPLVRQAIRAALTALAPAAQAQPLASPQGSELKKQLADALERYERALDAVNATYGADDPHAVVLSINERDRAAEVLNTWSQPEYLRRLLDMLGAALAKAPAARSESWPCSKCGIERSHFPACAQEGCPLMVSAPSNPPAQATMAKEKP